MDEQGRPVKWWARLLFEPREHSTTEYRLGLAVAGVAGLFTWLIFWTFIPTLIANTVIAIVNGISWVVGLFSGSGNGNEVAGTDLDSGDHGAAITIAFPLAIPLPVAVPVSIAVALPALTRHQL